MLTFEYICVVRWSRYMLARIKWIHGCISYIHAVYNIKLHAINHQNKKLICPGKSGFFLTTLWRDCGYHLQQREIRRRTLAVSKFVVSLCYTNVGILLIPRQNFTNHSYRQRYLLHQYYVCYTASSSYAY